jgi:hypothetical protein
MLTGIKKKRTVKSHTTLATLLTYYHILDNRRKFKEMISLVIVYLSGRDVLHEGGDELHDGACCLYLSG